MRSRLVPLVALTAAFLGSACHSANGTSADSPVTTTAATTPGADAGTTTAEVIRVAPDPAVSLTTLAISSGTLVPDFDPDVIEYSLTSMTSLAPITVTATTTSAAASVAVNGATAVSGAPLARSFAPDEDVSVVVKSGADSRTYTIHYRPSDLPTYTVKNDGRAGGERVLLTPSNKWLLMVDRAGAPLYYRASPGSSATDFEAHRLPDGTLVYSALFGTGYTAWTLGKSVVMDESLHDIAEVTLLPNRGHGALPSEGHDFLVLDHDHYVAMSYVQRTVDLHQADARWSTAAPVMAAVVQEVDHGSVVLEWDSADAPTLYTDSVDGNAFTSNVVSDYVHLNSIDVDPRDQNLVLSLRHTDSILKIDRHTGKTIWTLGGRSDEFGLTAAQRFSHQHHVRVQADGSLLVFDNGNNAHATRVLSFVLDEEGHEVEDFHVVAAKPADDPQTLFMGSAVQVSGDRTLVGWGGWSTIPASSPPSVTELIAGTPSWSLTFDAPNVFSYRALPVL